MIPNCSYTVFEQIRAVILDNMPFALINDVYHKPKNTAYFVLDGDYIPHALVKYQMIPPIPEYDFSRVELPLLDFEIDELAEAHLNGDKKTEASKTELWEGGEVDTSGILPPNLSQEVKEKVIVIPDFKEGGVIDQRVKRELEEFAEQRLKEVVTTPLNKAPIKGMSPALDVEIQNKIEACVEDIGEKPTVLITREDYNLSEYRGLSVEHDPSLSVPYAFRNSEKKKPAFTPFDTE